MKVISYVILCLTLPRWTPTLQTVCSRCWRIWRSSSSFSIRTTSFQHWHTYLTCYKEHGTTYRTPASQYPEASFHLALTFIWYPYFSERELAGLHLHLALKSVRSLVHQLFGEITSVTLVEITCKLKPVTPHKLVLTLRYLNPLTARCTCYVVMLAY